MGYGLPFYALNYAYINMLNAYGKTDISMTYSLIVNLLTIFTLMLLMLAFNLDNDIIIIMIAATHLLSRVIGTLFLSLSFKKVSQLLTKDIKLHSNLNPFDVLREGAVFLRLAFNHIIESVSYHLSQLFLTKIIASMGIQAVAARGYLFSVSGLLEIVPSAISKGAQIVIGQSFGTGLYKQTNIQLKKVILFSLSLTTVILPFVFYFSHSIERFHNYPANPAILTLFQYLKIDSAIS